MKNTVAFALICFLIFVLQLPNISFAETNIFSDNFENGNLGWTFQTSGNTATFANSMGYARIDVSSYANPYPKGYVILSRYIKEGIPPSGQSVSLTFDYKSEQQIQASIHTFSASDQWLGGYWKNYPPTSTWTNETISFTMPTGVGCLFPRFWALGTGIILIDNVKITITSPEPQSTPIPTPTAKPTPTPIPSPSPSSNSPIVSIVFDDGCSSQFDYAYPLMAQRGMKGTYYIITDKIDNQGWMSISEIAKLAANGNEIGSHSKTHRSFTSLNEVTIREECSSSKLLLESYGLKVTNFAYPYGDRNDWTDSIVADYFDTGRDAYSSAPSIMSLPTSQFRIVGYAGESSDGNALPRLKAKLDQLQSGNWLVVFFHNVEPDQYTKDWTISTQEFSGFLDYLTEKNIQVKTIREVLSSSQTSNPSPTPIPTSIPSPTPQPYANLIKSFSFYKTAKMNAIGTTTSEAYKIEATFDTSASNGESALWYQPQINTINAGEIYKFRAEYCSNVQSSLVIYTMSGSIQSLVVIVNLPASSSWKTSQYAEIAIPSGATSLHISFRLFNRETGWTMFRNSELIKT